MVSFRAICCLRAIFTKAGQVPVIFIQFLVLIPGVATSSHVTEKFSAAIIWAKLKRLEVTNRQYHKVSSYVTHIELLYSYLTRFCENVPYETLQIQLPIYEEQKFSTYGVIGHMVWQPYWICPKTFKNHLVQTSLTEGKLFTYMFPNPWGYQGVHK